MMLAEKIVEEDNGRVFIGRQAILDRKLATYAYELLFRSGSDNRAIIECEEKATAQVINNAFLEIGLDDLIGDKLAYINFTHDFLLRNLDELLPPDRVVLEVLENVHVDDELVEGIARLVKAGFTVALDDFEYHSNWDSLIPLAEVIKFDVMAIGLENLPAEIDRVKRPGLCLLAEKVETMEEFEACKSMGFDYFQGYFYAKPNLINASKMPDNQITLLKLMSRLQDPTIEIEEVEQLVSLNASLSYKLLRYINSALFALPKKIGTIRQAIIYFGLQRLKNWASLMAMTDIDNKPSELLQMGLTRARLCQLLAEATNSSDSDSYFMLGLFSILEALLDRRMEDIICDLPVVDGIKAALLGGKGKLGEALLCCEACESNSPAEMKFEGMEDQGFMAISGLYQDAILWSRQTLAEIG